jgi:Tfp pilus assembly protein PilF
MGLTGSWFPRLVVRPTIRSKRRMSMRTHTSTAAIAVVLLLAVIGCGGAEEKKAKYLARAQDYISDGNLPKARVALRNVLKIDPKDPEAYFFFA